MSRYSPSGYIMREVARIVRLTEVPPDANEVSKDEFWRYAALAMAYAKSDPDFAAQCLKDFRWWSRNLSDKPVTPKLASAARAYSTLHTRG